MLRNKYIPDEIRNYINSYPTFQIKHAKCEWDFWNHCYFDAMEKARTEHELFYNMFFGEKTDFPITMKEADDFLHWTEDLYCKHYDVKTSGFFEAHLPKVPKGILKL